MSMRGKLYRLALWYIGYYNKKWWKYDSCDLKSLKKLTYKCGDKYYLSFGMDNEWKNFSRYNVLNNAIQKLGAYEYNDITDDME